jgi:hypothetical protein
MNLPAGPQRDDKTGLSEPCFYCVRFSFGNLPFVRRQLHLNSHSIGTVASTGSPFFKAG